MPIPEPPKKKKRSSKKKSKKSKKSSKQKHKASKTEEKYVKETAKVEEVPIEMKKKKATISNLFGEKDDKLEGNSSRNYLPAYITQRQSSGYTKKAFENKPGTHYVELKIYECAEIENVSPMNRWRHSIFNLKNRTDTDAEAWKVLLQYMMAVDKEFADCRQYPISNNYN